MTLCNMKMVFISQEVQIMTSRWQKKADKTFMNAQYTVASSSDMGSICDQRNAKENLLIIRQHLSVEALSPCLLYIDM
jgi:hypothetical protein